MLFDLVSFFWKRQKLVQAANGMETQVIDGKVEIENGNVPEDKPKESEQSDSISPFHVPSMTFAYLLDQCVCLTWIYTSKGVTNAFAQVASYII